MTIDRIKDCSEIVSETKLWLVVKNIKYFEDDHPHFTAFIKSGKKTFKDLTTKELNGLQLIIKRYEGWNVYINSFQKRTIGILHVHFVRDQDYYIETYYSKDRKKLLLEYIYDGKATSVNQSYKISRTGKLYTTKEHKQMKEFIGAELLKIHNKFSTNNKTKLQVQVTWFKNFFHKNGKQKRIDIDDILKPFIDSVFDGIGIDDMFIWDLKAKKKQTEGNEKIEIKIFKLLN